MQTLHAGRDERDRPRVIKLTERQWVELGFQLGTKPKKIGCGKYGCAYLAHNADAVVKLTKDEDDALAAWALKNFPGGSPMWAIPVHAVYRLANNTFAICTALGKPLTEDWAGPIEVIYEFLDEEDVLAEDWDKTYKEIKREIEYMELDHGGPSRDDSAARKALELVNECVCGMKKVGRAIEDVHSANFALHSGRPVLIDLGSAKLEDGAAPAGIAYPKVKDIPVLPY